jgi:hypothetical protein
VNFFVARSSSVSVNQNVAKRPRHDMRETRSSTSSRDSTIPRSRFNDSEYKRWSQVLRNAQSHGNTPQPLRDRFIRTFRGALHIPRPTVIGGLGTIWSRISVKWAIFIGIFICATCPGAGAIWLFISAATDNGSRQGSILLIGFGLALLVISMVIAEIGVHYLKAFDECSLPELESFTFPRRS